MSLASCFLNLYKCLEFAHLSTKAFPTSVVSGVRILASNICPPADFTCCSLILALEDTVHYRSLLQSPQSFDASTDLYRLCLHMRAWVYTEKATRHYDPITPRYAAKLRFLANIQASKLARVTTTQPELSSPNYQPLLTYLSWTDTQLKKETACTYQHQIHHRKYSNRSQTSTIYPACLF